MTTVEHEPYWSDNNWKWGVTGLRALFFDTRAEAQARADQMNGGDSSEPASGESGPYRVEMDKHEQVVIVGPHTSRHGICGGSREETSQWCKNMNHAYAAGRASVQGVAAEKSKCDRCGGTGRVEPFLGDAHDPFRTDPCPACDSSLPTPDLRGALEECVKALEATIRFIPFGNVYGMLDSALTRARRELGGGA